MRRFSTRAWDGRAGAGLAMRLPSLHVITRESCRTFKTVFSGFRKGGSMFRMLLCLVAIGGTVGCAQLRPSSDPNAPNKCYTESGYLDSTNGCSVREGYPDCYLVCPDKGTRRKLQARGTANAVRSNLDQLCPRSDAYHPGATLCGAFAPSGGPGSSALSGGAIPHNQLAGSNFALSRNSVVTVVSL